MGACCLSSSPSVRICYSHQQKLCMKQVFIIIIVSCYLHSVASAQNIGIDVSNPSQKLDVNGRVRVQKAGVPGRLYTSPAASAGIVFGNIDDNTMGIYALNGWRFTMDLNNGRVGINTLVPSTTLDINTSLRIRGSSPLPGAVLTCMDANGTAKWLGPVSFRVSGTANNSPFTLSALWPNFQKLSFGNINYNSGNGWQQNNSQFMAPYTGVYHFSFKMRTVESDVKQIIWFMRSENGQAVQALVKETSKFFGGDFTWGDNNISICLDLKLNAGDAVWVLATNSVSGTSKCDGTQEAYYFTGQLISLL